MVGDNYRFLAGSFPNNVANGFSISEGRGEVVFSVFREWLEDSQIDKEDGDFTHWQIIALWALRTSK